MESFALVFSENVRGPICNNVTIINDDIYEFEERLTFNLSTADSSVDLDPASGVMIINDEDSELLFSSGLSSVWMIPMLVSHTTLNLNCRCCDRLGERVVPVQ